MKYRILGRTHFEVSDMAYGLWGMSGWTGSNDERVAAKPSNSPLTCGCNFFDTAWAYGEGKSDGAARRNPPAQSIFSSPRRFIGFTLRPKFLP